MEGNSRYEPHINTPTHTYLCLFSKRFVSADDLPDLVAKVVVTTVALQGLGFLVQAVDGALLGLDVQLQHLQRQTSLSVCTV